MEIVAPQNNIILKIFPKYIGNISSILNLSAIQNGASVDPADLVNIIGEIVSLPKTIDTAKRGYEGFSTNDIQVGDTAIFRFDVILDFIQRKPDAEKDYKNAFFYDAKEYWLCDIQKLFGVIRDGEIRMVNGYVMLADFNPATIFLPTSARKIRKAQPSEIMHIGTPKQNMESLDAKPGETVYFNPNLAAKYQIKGKPFRILQQEKILGKEAV